MNERTFGAGFHRTFAEGKLTLGIGVPLEAYTSPVPTMANALDMIQRAESANFAALWCRDVPLLDPSFGDAGQMYDPWVWLGYVAAHTKSIALGTSSIILPLRSPFDTAKGASSVDQLTGGRLLLGVASGDRPVEYSVYDKPFDSRDEAFRTSIDVIKKTTHKPPAWTNQMAVKTGRVELIPKSVSGDIPMFVTGHSRQSVEWIALHADGWMMYPRPVPFQTNVLAHWREALAEAGYTWKPFMQSLYIDLTAEPDAPAEKIHLGYRLGRNTLITLLEQLQNIGVNHVLFNIRFCRRPLVDVLDELAEYVIPDFPALNV